MQNAGFEVKTALHGRLALEVLKTFEPRLILVDFMMPEMDGISFLKHFKSSYPKSTAKIAFLTAKTDDQTQINALDTGADDFIAKPIRPNVLLSRIHAILRRDIDVAQANGNAILQLGDLKIDPEAFWFMSMVAQLIFPEKNSNSYICSPKNPERCLKEKKSLPKFGVRMFLWVNAPSMSIFEKSGKDSTINILRR